MEHMRWFGGRVECAISKSRLSPEGRTFDHLPDRRELLLILLKARGKEDLNPKA